MDSVGSTVSTAPFLWPTVSYDLGSDYSSIGPVYAIRLVNAAVGNTIQSLQTNSIPAENRMALMYAAPKPLTVSLVPDLAPPHLPPPVPTPSIQTDFGLGAKLDHYA